MNKEEGKELREVLNRSFWRAGPDFNTKVDKVIYLVEKQKEAALTTFQTSLIEKMEELFESNWPPAKADIIELIKNHK